MAKLNAQQIRDKFGFSYNEAHASKKGVRNVEKGSDIANTGAFYVDGNYIGTIDNFKSQTGRSDKHRAQGIESFKALEDYEQKHGFRESGRNSWNSYNDVAGAVRNIYGETEAPKAEPEPEPVDTSKPASQKLSKAQAYTQAYGDFRKSGGAVDQMAGNLGARDEFMDNYKLNLQRRMEPGVAHAVGNDDLPKMQEQQTKQKRSKIAADIVGKGAGFGQV